MTVIDKVAEKEPDVWNTGGNTWNTGHTWDNPMYTEYTEENEESSKKQLNDFTEIIKKHGKHIEEVQSSNGDKIHFSIGFLIISVWKIVSALVPKLVST